MLGWTGSVDHPVLMACSTFSAADEFKPINDLDRVKHFPDMVPEHGEISQQIGDEIRIVEVGDVSELATARTSSVAEYRERSQKPDGCRTRQ